MYETQYHRATSVEDAARQMGAAEDGKFLSGGMTLIPTMKQRLASPSHLIDLRHIPGLKGITITGKTVRIGAATTHYDVATHAELARLCPAITHLAAHIGDPQVRNMGTIGGNIANGSPIGDVPPVLIALGARVVLRHGETRRELPLEAFFLDYGKQDRAPGEFVETVVVPRPNPATLHSAWKISKRRDEDISSVAAGFAVTVADGTISDSRIAFGGMAGVPKRAAAAEAVLIGAPFDRESFARAAEALPQDFKPLSDWRASAEYRMRVAQNLFQRFWAEHGEAQQAELRRAEA